MPRYPHFSGNVVVALRTFSKDVMYSFFLLRSSGGWEEEIDPKGREEIFGCSSEGKRRIFVDFRVENAQNLKENLH